MLFPNWSHIKFLSHPILKKLILNVSLIHLLVSLQVRKLSQVKYFEFHDNENILIFEIKNHNSKGGFLTVKLKFSMLQDYSSESQNKISKKKLI